MTTFTVSDSSLEGQVPVFISPSNSVTQLYPQALGSPFVASYDSQGYGGGIRPRLYTSYTETHKVKVKVKVTLRLTVSQSVSLGIKPHLRPMTRYLFLSDSYVLVSVGRPL
jgi:hypothetical protein